MAGLLGLGYRPVAAEPPPETTRLRLVRDGRDALGIGGRQRERAKRLGRWVLIVLAVVGWLAPMRSHATAESEALPRIYSAVEGLVVAKALAELTLKGFSRPVAVYNVMEVQQG
jgi:hypothetical protein